MAGGILLWNRDVNPGGPQYNSARAKAFSISRYAGRGPG
jgi:hypothetical protein